MQHNVYQHDAMWKNTGNTLRTPTWNHIQKSCPIISLSSIFSLFMQRQRENCMHQIGTTVLPCASVYLVII